MPNKVCTKCKQEFPATREFFYATKHGKFGLAAVCKSCCKTYATTYNATHREVFRKSKAKYHERNLEYNRRYRAEHKEEIAEKHKRQYAQNPAIFRERYRKYCLEHPEKEAQRKTKWRENNPQKVKMWAHKRRFYKLTNTNEPCAFDRKEQFKRQHGKCYYCACKLSKYHVDHVIPLSRGGSNHPDNLVLACPSCNSKKHNKLPHEWPAGGRLL